jgi:uncharacterized protein (DUF362 family)
MKTLSACLIGAGLTGSEELFAFSEEAFSTLAIAKGDDPARVTAAALKDVVVVKPNMAWDRTPEQAANTNPMVVAEVVRLAYEAGAKKVKVFDNPCNAARRVYKRSGIAESAREAGAEVSFMDERKFKKTKLNGEVLKEWPVYTEALEADKLINVAIAKNHSLTGYTLSMKNLMGIIGGARNLLHQKIDINLADLAGFFKPTLSVLDATRILTANGPQGGNLSDVKEMRTVAASTDQVALDAFGTTLFGRKSDALACVREAYKRGLGEMDLTKVNIIQRVV